MMAGFPITINSLSGNGVVNVGGAFSISPLTVSKTVYGSGGGNTGLCPANESIQYISIFKLSIL